MLGDTGEYKDEGRPFRSQNWVEVWSAQKGFPDQSSMLSVQEMGHTEGLEKIGGEKSWRARAVTKDFPEEEVFGWALKDEKDLEVHFLCVIMEAEKRKSNSQSGSRWGSCLGTLAIKKSASLLQFYLYIVFPIKFAVGFSLHLDKVAPKCIGNNNLEEPR